MCFFMSFFHTWRVMPTHPDSAIKNVLTSLKWVSAPSATKVLKSCHLPISVKSWRKEKTPSCLCWRLLNFEVCRLAQVTMAPVSSRSTTFWINPYIYWWSACPSVFLVLLRSFPSSQFLKYWWNVVHWLALAQRPTRWFEWDNFLSSSRITSHLESSSLSNCIKRDNVEYFIGGRAPL